jgi:hypothetical protein
VKLPVYNQPSDKQLRVLVFDSWVAFSSSKCGTATWGALGFSILAIVAAPSQSQKRNLWMTMAFRVSIELNIDEKNELFELDFWKVDFSPVETLSEPRRRETVEVGGEESLVQSRNFANDAVFEVVGEIACLQQLLPDCP